MATNNVAHKTELAFLARGSTIASTLSLNAYTGVDVAERELPAVTYYAESSEPVVENQTNRIVTMAVSVQTNMDDTSRADHHSYAAQVMDVFYDDDLASELNSANSSFTCLGWEHLGEESTFEDRSATTTLRLRLHVCPADIA